MVGNNIGSGSAYWTSWEIDAIGNRTKQTERNLTGGNDTTTYTYNGNGQNKPHTLTATSTTGAATGTTAYTYDTAGNMTGRNAAQGNQTLGWDDAGKLASVAGGTSGTNTFTYDADGNLLLQKEPAKTTLYLPGQQLTLNTTTGTIDGDRHHTLPGGGTCIRSGTGTNYTFALADHQGTPTLYLDNIAQTPTWRQYTPYGGPRGTTVTYPDNRGFLNKPMSPTGLTTIGARTYDPALGRFISVDPIIDLAAPQQWHGYSYADNSPITRSDPTGLISDCSNGTSGKSCDNNYPGGSSGGGSPSSPTPPPSACQPGRPCPAPGPKPGPKPVHCPTVMLNGSCLDAKIPQLRPGNLKNGATQFGLDRAIAQGGSCELIALQIICYESEGVLADGHPQTIGDVLLFPGNKKKYKEWLEREAEHRKWVARTCDKVQCLDPAVFGRDIEKHEAAHSEQWSHYKGPADYGLSYGAWQLESKLSCGEWGRCNKFEVDANPFHGGYWDPPVVGPEGYFVPGPRTPSIENLERLFGL